MNIINYITMVLLMSSVLTVLRAEEPKTYVAETTASSETFRSRVLKVHHFIEADFEYLAYTIDWKGHEVVVYASSTDEILKEGDEIRCLMRSAPLKVGENKKAALTFSIITSPIAPRDDARLRAVAAEVNRRRVIRAAEEAKAAE
jgi:hypothetical protein